MKDRSERRWYFETGLNLLFKLHPLILLFSGLLNANEAFLVMILSYAMNGIFALARSGFTYWYDFVLNVGQKSVFEKVGSFIGYLIGHSFLLIVSLFLMLIYFGNLADAVFRPLPMGYLKSPDASVLLRSLLINAIWFFLIETIHFVRFVRNYSDKDHDVVKVWFFHLSFRSRSKWFKASCWWFLCGYAAFLFLLTSQAFNFVIITFFLFDFVFVFLQHMDERSKMMTENF